MKKFIPLLLVAVVTMFACNTTTTNPLFADLILPKEEGAFRGVNFNMTKEEVKDIETSRSTVSILEDESDDYLTITSDMGDETLNFADVTYDFDEKGLYSITVETYAKTAEEANETFKLVAEHFTSKYGEATIAEDGFSEWTGEAGGHKFSVAAQNITDLEDSYGMYIYLDIVE